MGPLKILLVSSFLFCGNFASSDDDDYVISVVHFNDFHARFDVQSKGSGPCKDPEECHGGFSRLYYKINELLQTRPNPILLNAGDNFQGTLWYNIFKWNITQYFMNMLPAAAYTLGNHEFDQGITGLVPYLQAMKAPCVLCNIDDSLEPDLQGLYNKSIIIEVQGKRIGIIGVVTSLTATSSSPGKVKFLDEIESVNAEALKLLEQNVFTIIVLSHCGYDLDKVMAAKAVKGIGLIVGAHSHSLLYTGNPPDGSKSHGPYPTIIQREVDGKNVLITQASCYTRYLGDITLKYDNNGDIKLWDGVPIFLSHEVPQDPAINNLLLPYKTTVDAAGNAILGKTLKYLDFKSCKYQECILGDFVTDAIVSSFEEKAAPNCLTYVSIAFMNAGGMRSNIEVGDITFNDLTTAIPFQNTIDSGVLKGKHLKSVLEQTATPISDYEIRIGVILLQVSGLKIVYDLSQSEGSRVASLQVKDPCSGLYEPLDLEEDYRVAMVSFLSTGGNGFKSISDNFRDVVTGKLDSDVVMDYMHKLNAPLDLKTEDRITFVGSKIPKYSVK